MINRIFLIVLDSFGVGELPDADRFSDRGSHTLRSVAASAYFHAPNLQKLGLFNLPGISDGRAVDTPSGAFGKCAEQSMGKDTVMGHWEIAGVISPRAMPTYPDGFPDEVMERIEKATGIGAICNLPYSGTDVIRDYGREQLSSGKMIVYTSGDSVFQAAGHDAVFTSDELYDYCRKARAVLQGEHAVGRVIARPYSGVYPNYYRTEGRHDFALEPPADTLLDVLMNAGLATICVGKIRDIFAGRGVGTYMKSASNREGMVITEQLLQERFHGLCFVNLVEFDTLYGHRNDVDGYAAAISRFDDWLGSFIPQLQAEDILMITADHGCDPLTPSTDHSREYVPILSAGPRIRPGTPLGVRESYADIGRTICDIFGVDNHLAGKSFADCLFGTEW